MTPVSELVCIQCQSQLSVRKRISKNVPIISQAISPISTFSLSIVGKSGSAQLLPLGSTILIFAFSLLHRVKVGPYGITLGLLVRVEVMCPCQSQLSESILVRLHASYDVTTLMSELICCPCLSWLSELILARLLCQSWSWILYRDFGTPCSSRS